MFRSLYHHNYQTIQKVSQKSHSFLEKQYWGKSPLEFNYFLVIIIVTGFSEKLKSFSFKCLFHTQNEVLSSVPALYPPPRSSIKKLHKLTPTDSKNSSL